MELQPKPAPASWFVQTAGRVWGPYPGARIQAFVHEGRIGPQTPIGRSAEGPFAPAGEHRRLRELFEAKGASPPQGAKPAPQPADGPLRALVVWADLNSVGVASFEEMLKANGAAAPIRPGLWLLKSRLDPATLRNLVSRRLGEADALLVMEAPLERTAWFNLGGAERALRHLWAGSE